jgi:hypothetical protein
MSDDELRASGAIKRARVSLPNTITTPSKTTAKSAAFDQTNGNIDPNQPVQLLLGQISEEDYNNIANSAQSKQPQQQQPQQQHILVSHRYESVAQTMLKNLNAIQSITTQNEELLDKIRRELASPP